MTTASLGSRHGRGHSPVWRTLSLFASLLCAGFVPAGFVSFAQSDAAVAESAGGPRLKIDNREIDFGEVVRGEVAEGEFKIENIGDQSLFIEKAQPGCGCTLASYDAVIPPGQTGSVRVSLDTSKQPRRTTGRYVTVYSNDPIEPRLQLTLAATVVGSVEIKPQEKLQLGNRRNQKMEPVVIVRKDPTETGTLEVSDIVTSSEFLDVAAERVQAHRGATDEIPAAEPGDWILRLSLTGEAPFLRGRETVRFRTGLPREPEKEITLYISYDAPFELSTPQVELNLDGEGNSPKETVFLKVRNGLDGDIAVETDPAELQVTLRDLGRLQYHADIVWSGGDRKVGSVYFRIGDEQMRLPVVRKFQEATAASR